MRKIVYDEKYHAEALLEILEMKDTCIYCPMLHGHGGEFKVFLKSLLNYFLGTPEEMQACKICTSFVNTGFCPCKHLGKKEAIKRTWIALEEKGYI